MGISAAQMFAPRRLRRRRDEGTIFGSISRGTPKMASSSSSQSPVARFISMVRDALVGSVTCDAPLVSFQISQVSTLPNSRSPWLAADMIEDPADLAGGKIGVDHQAGFALDGLARLQSVAIGRGAAALPDDGGRDRLAGAAIPDHGGFALIGDADGGDVATPWHVAAFKRPPRGIELRAPDGVGVLLHPAGLRINAIDGARFHRDAAAFLIVERGARAGGSFVQGENVRHSRIIMKSVCSFAATRFHNRLSRNASRNLKQYGFQSSRAVPGRRSRDARTDAARSSKSLGDGKVKIGKAGVLIGDEIGDAGEPRISDVPAHAVGREIPALATHLKKLHAFDEDLREGLGLTSLYNLSLGTTTDEHLYDRVVDRDKGAAFVRGKNSGPRPGRSEQKGSHRAFRHPEKPLVVTVPGNWNDLPIGTLKSQRG